MHWEEPLIPGAPFPRTDIPYHVDFHITNDGTEDAQEIKGYSQIYVGKADDQQEQRQLKKIFDKEWQSAPEGLMPINRGTHPYWTVTKTFTPAEAERISKGETVYFFGRVQYKDSLGRWNVDYCHDIQTSQQGIQLLVAHSCEAITSSRYPARP